MQNEDKHKHKKKLSVVIKSDEPHTQKITISGDKIEVVVIHDTTTSSNIEEPEPEPESKIDLATLPDMPEPVKKGDVIKFEKGYMRKTPAFTFVEQMFVACIGSVLVQYVDSWDIHLLFGFGWIPFT
ncbi:TPA: hypothetical protein ACP5VK_004377 [Vibrio parahaemolyticus]